MHINITHQYYLILFCANVKIMYKLQQKEKKINTNAADMLNLMIGQEDGINKMLNNQVKLVCISLILCTDSQLISS